MSQILDSSNLALKKPAFQSSLYEDNYPSLAVDGNYGTNYEQCSHTGYDTGAWWAVDLGQEYFVSEVVITNRGSDCESCGN